MTRRAHGPEQGCGLLLTLLAVAVCPLAALAAAVVLWAVGR